MIKSSDDQKDDDQSNKEQQEFADEMKKAQAHYESARTTAEEKIEQGSKLTNHQIKL